MSRPKHSAARQHFAQLIKEMGDNGAFTPETLERLNGLMADGPGLYVLDDDGKTPRRARDMMEWARMFGGRERQLASDRVGRVTVSTVFLGIDHNYFGGPPLVFETMVFGGEHGGQQNRYATYDDAIAGHRWWLAKVTKSEGN